MLCPGNQLEELEITDGGHESPRGTGDALAEARAFHVHVAPALAHLFASVKALAAKLKENRRITKINLGANAIRGVGGKASPVRMLLQSSCLGLDCAEPIWGGGGLGGRGLDGSSPTEPRSHGDQPP